MEYWSPLSRSATRWVTWRLVRTEDAWRDASSVLARHHVIHLMIYRWMHHVTSSWGLRMVKIMTLCWALLEIYLGLDSCHLLQNLTIFAITMTTRIYLCLWIPSSKLFFETSSLSWVLWDFIWFIFSPCEWNNVLWNKWWIT